MESWRKVWRDGVSPLLSDAALQALAVALERDDSRLLQGSTTVPAPLPCLQDCPVEGACALSYCGWQGEGLVSVGDVESYFAKMCFDVDFRLGEPGAAKWFVCWWDETPRDRARRLLLAEVRIALGQRHAEYPAA
jgi:hypothetical protein